MNLLLSLPKRFEMLFLFFNGCIPVSYTHLDVYKRQICQLLKFIQKMFLIYSII